jgi:hypothetical protein
VRVVTRMIPAPCDWSPCHRTKMKES